MSNYETLQRLFIALQSRMIDAGTSLVAGNFEALIEDLNSMTTDIDVMRDAVFGSLEKIDAEGDK